MPILARGSSFQVTVNRASAKQGYRRIRRNYPTLPEAEAAEAEIEAALETYGKWPVEEGDKPLRIPVEKRTTAATGERNRKAGDPGTLREAMQIALDVHWAGTRYFESVRFIAPSMVSFLEQRGVVDLDDITSEDLDALIQHHRGRGLMNSSVNKYLGALRVINRLAVERKPPLATKLLPIPHLRKANIAKWWLRPEDHQQVVKALRDPQDDSLTTNPMFADLIDIIVYLGLRVEEALRLEAWMVHGLDGREPWLNPDGTKTAGSDNAVPVYPEAVEPMKRSIQRAEKNRWPSLFPITPRVAAGLWNEVREFLGVADVPTSTMKALRRTFAWYATSRGMPTGVLQQAMRHKNITTTEGYLKLVGTGALEDSRKYFSQNPTPKEKVGIDVGSIIAAYAKTPGVTPEDVARFAKALMT